MTNPTLAVYLIGNAAAIALSQRGTAPRSDAPRSAVPNTALRTA